MYGRWNKATKKSAPSWSWVPEKEGPLSDPYNRFIHVVFFLSNGHQLVLSDARKFAKVALFNTSELKEVESIKTLGPEPLEKTTTSVLLKTRLMKRPTWPIKQALLNQELLAGIGNIYSDEILWAVGLHPKELVKNISTPQFKKIYKVMVEILNISILLGGDSTSDYRNIEGVRGGFQNSHKAYRRVGEKCLKKDGGTIQRIKVAGRSSHFCDKHQRLTKKKNGKNKL